MKRMAALHSGPQVLPVGSIAKLQAADVDWARIDPIVIVVVVIEVTECGMYRCATEAGIINPVFHHGDLEYMKLTTPVNSMPTISVQQAVHKVVWDKD